MSATTFPSLIAFEAHLVTQSRYSPPWPKPSAVQQRYCRLGEWGLEPVLSPALLQPPLLQVLQTVTSMTPRERSRSQSQMHFQERLGGSKSQRVPARAVFSRTEPT